MEEAEKVVRLRGVAAHDRGLTDPVRERRALAQRAVLHCGREERRGVDLLPKVESVQCRSPSTWRKMVTVRDLRRLVPVVCDVVEVKLDDRPKRVRDIGRVVVVQQPVGIGDDRGSPQSRPI